VLLYFHDTETTSLDADSGQVWEVGGIERWYDDDNKATETQYCWQLPVSMEGADPMSLIIGRFRERRLQPFHVVGNNMENEDDIRTMAATNVNGEVVSGNNVQRVVLDHQMMYNWCEHFATLTHKAHLVGNVVSFDEERLRKLLLSHDVVPTWHYHLVDVEALVAGRLGIQPPWNSKALSRAIGIEPPKDQHAALVDAIWARDMYDRVFGVADESQAAQDARHRYTEMTQ
jgi:hypothetical protein